jgi:uncharacterized protein YbaP (TraB family)
MGIYDNERDPNVEMWENENNHNELLTDEQIKSIHEQLVVAFRDDTDSLVEMILNNWLAEDKNMLWANMDELITQAKNGELLSIDQVNTILNEDSHDNNI